LETPDQFEARKVGLRELEDASGAAIEGTRPRCSQNRRGPVIALAGGEDRPENWVAEEVGNPEQRFRRERSRSTVTDTHGEEVPFSLRLGPV